MPQYVRNVATLFSSVAVLLLLHKRPLTHFIVIVIIIIVLHFVFATHQARIMCYSCHLLATVHSSMVGNAIGEHGTQNEAVVVRLTIHPYDVLARKL